jgi:hypothetical protein
MPTCMPQAGLRACGSSSPSPATRPSSTGGRARVYGVRIGSSPPEIQDQALRAARVGPLQQDAVAQLDAGEGAGVRPGRAGGGPGGGCGRRGRGGGGLWTLGLRGVGQGQGDHGDGGRDPRPPARRPRRRADGGAGSDRTGRRLSVLGGNVPVRRAPNRLAGGDRRGRVGGVSARVCRPVAAPRWPRCWSRCSGRRCPAGRPSCSRSRPCGRCRLCSR